jgi:hypothetical protein
VLGIPRDGEGGTQTRPFSEPPDRPDVPQDGTDEVDAVTGALDGAAVGEHRPGGTTDMWNELWRNVTARTVPPIKDAAAVFKSEYDNVPRNLRGTARLLPDAVPGSKLKVVSAARHYDLNTLLTRYAYVDDDGWTGGDSTYIRRFAGRSPCAHVLRYLPGARGSR